MKDLLIVYNVCGLSGRENHDYYTQSLMSLQNQSMVGSGRCEIAISACKVSDQSRRHLLDFRLPSGEAPKWSFNFIDDALPLSVTFNHTVRESVRAWGPFKGYLYVDSGMTFHGAGVPEGVGQEDALSLLYSIFQSGPYGITAAFPSNDDGSSWWGIHYDMVNDYVFPIGKTTNMHCQIFSNDLLNAYGRLLPDIFASDTSESVFTFLCAALRKKMVITPRVLLQHAHAMDGPSSGFSGQLLFRTTRPMEERYRQGRAYGFGYEEWKTELGMLHDPERFDEHGYAKDDRLAPYLKESLFLTAEEFDYDSIKYEWIARSNSALSQAVPGGQSKV